MSVITASLFMNSSAAAAYQISRSLRFNDGDTAYMSRTPGGAGDRKTWALSVWVKRGNLGSTQYIWSAGSAATDYTAVFFDASDKLNLIRVIASATDAQYVTTAVYRDPGAWMHIVVSHDAATTACTLYVNGAAITALDTTNAPSNINGAECNAVLHEIGRRSYTPAGTYFDGYMAELKFVDGTASAASVFGETSASTGAWVPKTSAPTHGTTGHWLSFANAASTTTLGYDDAGGAAGAGAGSNDWTLTNLATTDSVTDTPTNNYAVLNPLNMLTTVPSDGNLFQSGSSNDQSVGTIKTTTPAYFEITFTTIDASNGYPIAGVIRGTPVLSGALHINTNVVGIDRTKAVYKFGTNTGTLSGTAFSATDVCQVAFNPATGKVWFGRNGTWLGSGDPATDSTPAASGLTEDTYFPVVAASAAQAASVTANFGQGGQSGLTYDAASGGTFKYTPPTGFKALSTANITTPAILKPSQYFNSVIYTGTGASLAITGAGHQPDLVWIKGRSGATDHTLYDSVRGVQARLESNTTDDEAGTDAGLTAFGSDGFTVNTLAQVNTNTATYVGWSWNESNATAGLDIVSYTGNGANRTINHSLGAAAHFMIVKARTTAGANTNWAVYHRSNTAAPETDYLLLNSTAATADLDTYWNDTAPTSSVFSLGTHADVNTNSDTYIAYLWTEIAGFSKFGSYTGNGAADGPFVYCGFRPRWVMVKSSSNALSWYVWDAARDTYNVAVAEVLAEAATAEAATADLDILSNGFKIRATTAGFNTNAATYVFAAFAEMPFKYSTAR